MMSEFGTVYLSRKCYENFRREHLGKDNFREENPIHRPYVRISKILTGYEPPSLSNLRVIGGKQEKQEQPIEYIGCVDCEGLHSDWSLPAISLSTSRILRRSRRASTVWRRI